jgi:hypothetical protein
MHTQEMILYKNILTAAKLMRAKRQILAAIILKFKAKLKTEYQICFLLLFIGFSVNY